MPAMDSAAALLLELAASDDLPAFRRAVESDHLPINASSAWYGRWCSFPTQNKPTMAFQQRTPLMVAATYGSTSVLRYILSTTPTLDVNHPSPSDSATALHCAAAGGAPTSAETIKLLLDAAADVTTVDAAGNRPFDLVPRQKQKPCELLVGTGEAEEAVGSPALAKKEYPVDSTLPDIKSGVYGTDEFRMYTFKVKPCSRAYSHDWTECPFVHPGENARRRDPRKYHYSCVPCPEFRKGTCRNGDSCEYAHGVFESWLHPAQYRTRLCKDETGCNRRVCFFAHKPEELRPLYPSTGSPRAATSLPPLDLGATAAMLMSQPMSPSATWLNQTAGVGTPSYSRLKSAMSARDLDLDLGMNLNLLGLDAYQKLQLADELGLNTRNAGDALGSLLSPMKTLSLSSQFQSPPKQHNLNMNQQLLSGYAAGNLPVSPSARSGSPPSLALASSIMNSRAAAFAKRSQSFIDRRQAVAAPSLSDWGSPSGKLDWGIQGEELNKLRKSASFNFRANGASNIAAVAAEPDVSSMGGLGVEQNNNTKQYHLNSSASEFPPGDMFLSWADQLYLEQKQMVA